jgi:hypothetical protein
MEMFLQNGEEKKGINKIFLAAIAVGVLIIAGGIWLLTLQPTAQEQKQQELAGAHLEGSPEFDGYTKNIIVTTDMNRTTESPLPIGTIVMQIHGDIRNKGDRAINGLEVKVGVVDINNKVIKEKKVLIVPNQIASLQPNETIHVSVPMDGFNKKDDRANVRWKVTAIRFQ